MVSLEIVEKKRNPLLRRYEVVFEVDHSDIGGTPPRTEVRKLIAEKLGVDFSVVYVRKYETMTGTMKAVGRAHVYDSVEEAKFIEPDYIIARNEGKTGEEGE